MEEDTRNEFANVTIKLQTVQRSRRKCMVCESKRRRYGVLGSVHFYSYMNFSCRGERVRLSSGWVPYKGFLKEWRIVSFPLGVEALVQIFKSFDPGTQCGIRTAVAS